MLREIWDEIFVKSWVGFRRQSPQIQAMCWLFLAMIGCVGISHAFGLYRVSSSWSRIEYDWAYLIPILAIIVFYYRRQPIQPASTVEQLAGAGLILAVTIARYVFYVTYSVEQPILYSIVACIAGLMLMLGGFKMMAWAWPALMLLMLGIPFSEKMERVSFQKLQTVSTKASRYTLETLGVDVSGTGNELNLRRDGEDVPLNVAEACAGFRGMLTAISLTFTVVLFLKCDLWIKIILVLSSLPIALFTNVLRIVLQCMAFQWSTEVADFFHDYVAQFVVFPAIFGLLYLEYHILRNLVLDDHHTSTVKPIVPGVLHRPPPMQPQRQPQPQ